ncbi:MAG: TIGR03435 family protein [Bryobacteraceae bacterium]|jgi:uncharacterized protein (TIGR03435 family)
MKRTCASTILLSGLLSSAALGQPAATAPAFEMADVHVAPPGEPSRGGGFVPGGRFEVRGVTMLRLISMAYGVYENDKIQGGPGWLDTDKFDIIAKAPAGTPQTALQPMLEALLADRFKLAVHNETKPLPIFALVVGKRPQLKESAAPGDAECRMNVVDGVRTYTCHNMTMEGFTQRLPGVAAAYLNHPLMDFTGLKGAYDFALHWTGRNAALPASSGDADPPAPISVFEAVDKQLGLKIESRQQPLPVIVVDHVNQTPTDNAPGVTTSLPPVPTEFEVAEIKVSKPGVEQSGSINPGRIEVFGITMKEMLNFAYDVEEDKIAGAPKWTDTDHFDLIAKTPSAVPFESMRVMLQNLIVQKFKFTFHKEDQPMPVFALTVGKRSTKLKDADPSNRSACTRTAGDGTITYACQNTTMAQLAEKVRSAAPGYITRPVVDLTGLKGAFDFAITWAPSQLIAAGAGRGADPAVASTPTGGLTFFEAIDKQLGLKLESQKYPQPVMVIDHLERLPADN